MKPSRPFAAGEAQGLRGARPWHFLSLPDAVDVASWRLHAQYSFARLLPTWIDEALVE